MKIDYKLNIIGEKIDYSPRIEFINPIVKSDLRIFEITAGNGYGKTFMLNLIAYACFADKLSDKYILKSLKDSISRYNNQDSYKLSYHLEFNLQDGKKIALFKESTGERSIEFDGYKSYNYKDIHKTISVIYDVPTDPSERLNAVINDLGNWNVNLHHKMKTYWEFLRGIQSDFDNIRDESKITLLKEANISLDREIENLQKVIESIKVEIHNLNIYDDLKKLSYEYQKCLTYEGKLSKSQNKIQSLQKPESIDKKDENVIRELQIEKNKYKIEIADILSNLITFISGNQELTNLIKGKPTLNKFIESLISSKIEDIIDNIIASEEYVSELNKFINSINNLEEEIKFYIRSEEKGKKYVIYNFLKQLLQQIESLDESYAEDILEAITNKKPTFIIDEINKSMLLYKTSDFSEIKLFFRDRLSKTKSIISDVFKLNGKLIKESTKKGVDSNGELYYSTKAEIDSYKNILSDVKKNIEKLKHKSSLALNIDISRLDCIENVTAIISPLSKIYDKRGVLNDLSIFLKNKTSEIAIKEDQKKKFEDSKRMNQARLELEQKKKISQFDENEKEKINTFVKYLGFLIKNLGEFNTVISSINSGDLIKFKDKEDEGFINIAGRIIAYSMDNKILRPDGEYIQLLNYDMLKKEFQCVNDITIKKDDISTGLASANYLRQRIENAEGDNVIVLLDEIGNMAKNTLGEVIKSIKKLESQNRLVLALLTQPSSEGIMINEY